MHELSIAQNIIDVLRDEQARRRFARVRTLRLRIGALSNVVPEALQFSFEAIRDDTPLRGTELEIERVPAVARCRNCSSEVRLDDALLLCEVCGSMQLTVLSGEELEIASIDVEGERAEPWDAPDGARSG
jgi:hydrogenase nickel incorporation protein HypA/HybF